MRRHLTSNTEAAKKIKYIFRNFALLLSLVDGRTTVSDPTTLWTSDVQMFVRKACYISRVIRRHFGCHTKDAHISPDY